MATISDAINYLRNSAPKNFPNFAHSSVGDFICVFFNGDDFFEKRVDHVLTIHYSKEDPSQIVGCKLKGISILAKNVLNIVEVTDNNIDFKLLLLNAAGADEVKQHYYDLSKIAPPELQISLPAAA